MSGPLPLLSVIAAITAPMTAAAKDAVLFDGRQVAGIVHDGSSSARLAGELLARDLSHPTGRAATVASDLSGCTRLCVVIGTVDSSLVAAIARDAGVALSALNGTWERYGRVLVRRDAGPGNICRSPDRIAAAACGGHRPDPRTGGVGMGMVGRRRPSPSPDGAPRHDPAPRRPGAR